MIASASVHPSHFHIVAASIVKEQEDIRLRVRTLVNDPDAQDLAQHRASVEVLKRMSHWVEQPAPICCTCKEILLEDAKRLTLCRSPRVCQQSSTSILPPQLFDVWPRILEYLLQRTARLRRLLGAVDRIYTRFPRAKTVWNAVWVGVATPQFPAMIASGLWERGELQLLMEMLFSDIYGCRYNPTTAWHEVLADAATIKGWQLPAIRTWGDYDLSDGEGDGDEMVELVDRMETAGFRAEVLRRPYHNPEIKPDTVMVVTPLGHIQPAAASFHYELSGW